MVLADQPGQVLLPLAVQRGPEQFEGGPGEVLDQPYVVGGQLHQPGQDEQGQVGGEVGVQVHGPVHEPPGQRRHPAADHPRQPGPLYGDPGRVQRLGDGRPQDRVRVGAVVGQRRRQPEPVPDQDPHRGHLDRGDRVEGVVRPVRPGIGEHPADQVVPGHDDVPVHPRDVVDDRRGLPQPEQHAVTVAAPAMWPALPRPPSMPDADGRTGDRDRHVGDRRCRAVRGPAGGAGRHPERGRCLARSRPPGARSVPVEV